MSGGIVQRIVGAAFALVSGGAIGRFAIKNPAQRNSFITGTAAAVLVEAAFPGKIASLLVNVPVVGPFFAAHASPVAGLAGLFGTDDIAGIGAYVLAKNYQGQNGLGAYVMAKNYQGQNGLGAYVKMPNNPGSMNGLGTYVQARNYQGQEGVSGDPILNGLGYRGERLAGLDGMGSNMPSHLDS